MARKKDMRTFTENEIENSVVENEEPATDYVTVAELPKVEPKQKKKVFVSSEGILCRSVTAGSLYIDGPKSGMLYQFSDYGDVCEIEYRDLKGLIMNKSKYVYNPNFIIEDQDFIDENPSLKKFYNEHYTVRDFRKILRMPDDEMLNAISILPPGAMANFKSYAATYIYDGKIDSLKKIKTLDKLWGTNMALIVSEG